MTAPAAVPAKTNTVALVSFICAFVVPVAGLVLGIIAVRQLRGNATGEGGAGLARWAMIIGSVGICGQAILFIIWISLFTQAMAR
ncbi:MAG: DUF4190 domain-containing protein [Microbacterium sp.]|jgi:hypothetical protein|uniref:DUF4190 domain-containing protein n=1 Tax=Microbacterium sp. TaxID=51671 RepID=UPI0028379FD5|nr:DUF4190 domain-containing protein [Microbacterium sp.]MDR2322295.1 DUF4190 domain-containing protein [Microbacterium sp.]